jgi:hypothetical protein
MEFERLRSAGLRVGGPGRQGQGLQSSIWHGDRGPAPVRAVREPPENYQAVPVGDPTAKRGQDSLRIGNDQSDGFGTAMRHICSFSNSLIALRFLEQANLATLYANCTVVRRIGQFQAFRQNQPTSTRNQPASSFVSALGGRRSFKRKMRQIKTNMRHLMRHFRALSSRVSALHLSLVLWQSRSLGETGFTGGV